MDVRISYGINIDDVPDKLIDMLNKLDIDELYQLMSVSRQLIETSNMEMANTLIEKTRVKLASMDRSLHDTQMILAGYVNAKNVQTGETKEEAENAD